LTKTYVIICEGLHNQLFSYFKIKNKALNPICCSKARILRHNGGESTIIRNFIHLVHSKAISSKKRILLKDDGDKTVCMDTFIELLKQGDIDYELVIILDADSSSIRQFQKKMQMELKQNLIKINSNSYKTKNKHKIFFIPTSLEKEIENNSGKDLHRVRNPDKKKSIIKEFIRLNQPWAQEFEDLIFCDL